MSLPSIDRIAVFSNPQKCSKEVAARLAEEQLNLKLIAKSVLNDSFTLNETSVFLLGSVRSVLPVAAIAASEHKVNINNNISSRKNYSAFFHLLSYNSCIDAVDSIEDDANFTAVSGIRKV